MEFTQRRKILQAHTHPARQRILCTRHLPYNHQWVPTFGSPGTVSLGIDWLIFANGYIVIGCCKVLRHWLQIEYSLVCGTDLECLFRIAPLSEMTVEDVNVKVAIVQLPVR